MVRLDEQNHAHISNNGHVVIRSSSNDGDQLEREVFDELKKQSGSTVDLKSLMQTVKNVSDSYFSRLRELKLLPGSSANAIGVGIPVMLCLAAVFLFGLTRLIMGMVNDRPFGYLLVSIIVAVVVSLIAFARRIRRTRKADAVLANLSQRHGRLRTLSNDLAFGDASLAVATFGVGVLAGTAYADLHSRMQKFDNKGAGGGCGSTGCSATGCGGGSGGDGGGGGGCGGCGGGGGD
jgi:uncharacterized protein (TIGR04222 family)